MQNSKKIFSFGLYHDLSPKPLPYPTAERVTPALIEDIIPFLILSYTSYGYKT